MSTLTNFARSSIKFYRLATGPVRLKPDFIVIGVQRGGTTSLYNYLTEHPAIASASMKEVHFFDNNYQRGINWYQGQFPTSMQKYYNTTLHKQFFTTGEASPYYLFHPHTAKRAAEAVPQTKLIVLLRNPVERTYSHYYHEVELGHERLSFMDALDQEEARTRDETEKMQRAEHYYSYNHQHYTYVARGKYAEQLENWFRYFPREQFLIIKSEDFYEKPHAIMQETFDFLGVPASMHKKQPGDYKTYNNSKYGESKLSPEVRKRLTDYFAPHNERLYALLGRDFSWDNI